MAVKYYCDRCNKEVQNNTMLHAVTFEKSISRDVYIKELCRTCFDRTKSFVNTPPPQAA